MAVEDIPPVEPNSGVTLSVADAQKGMHLVDPERWTKKNGGDKIKIVKLSHMIYGHTDLAVITEFLYDFGMTIAKKTETTVWFKGYGVDPYVYVAEKCEGEKEFRGGCFEVESYEDLERASKLPNASPIIKLTDSPGGGHRVTLYDPEGFRINLIHGQTPISIPPTSQHPELIINNEFSKPRKNQFQRFKQGPAAVHKLGHFGLTIHDFEKTFNFYTSTFNLVPSDILYVDQPDGSKLDVAAFLHVDRGLDYVDHHIFFFAVAEKKHVHHSSYEVHDFDTQSLGHKWLEKKWPGKLVWGVGRHILGSQIFDYWWDPVGFMVEHYVDGDLVNEETPTGYGEAGDESLAVWGPDVPATFLH